jgi:hypothetical protein
MSDQSIIEKAFLAVMNANDRELGLPLTAWAERNLLKRRIAVAIKAVAPVPMDEQQMEDIAREWLEVQFSEGSGEGNHMDAVYSADWVIDAFIAGMQHAAGGAK